MRVTDIGTKWCVVINADWQGNKETCCEMVQNVSRLELLMGCFLEHFTLIFQSFFTLFTYQSVAQMQSLHTGSKAIMEQSDCEVTFCFQGS